MIVACVFLPLAVFLLFHLTTASYTNAVRRNTLQLYSESNQLLTQLLGSDLTNPTRTRPILQQFRRDHDVKTTYVLISTPNPSDYKVLASTNEQEEGKIAQNTTYGSVVRERAATSTFEGNNSVRVISPILNKEGAVLALVDSEYDAEPALGSLDDSRLVSYLVAGFLSALIVLSLLLAAKSSRVRQYRKELSDLKNQHSNLAAILEDQLSEPLEYAYNRAANLKDTDTRDHLIEQLDIARSNVKRLQTFFEESEQIVLEPIDLGDIVDQLVKDHAEQAASKDLKLSYDIPSMAAVVLGDRSALQIVINELLDNAIKFTDTGSVRLSHHDTDELVRLEVADTGSGLQGNNLFSPFIREKQKTPGVGLGLWHVKQYVELMGGAIAIESSPSKGSAITIELTRVQKK